LNILMIYLDNQDYWLKKFFQLLQISFQYLIEQLSMNLLLFKGLKHQCKGGNSYFFLFCSRSISLLYCSSNWNAIIEIWMILFKFYHTSQEFYLYLCYSQDNNWVHILCLALKPMVDWCDYFVLIAWRL